MKTDAFSTPQRQSVTGILLIFLSSLYRFFKGFWILGVYYLLSSPGAFTTIYMGLALGFFFFLVLIYSFVYYQKFLFHIDYRKEEFILEKGVFSTENIAVPFEKIQQVYSRRSLLQRVLNIASLVIDTAGSRESEVSIKAISEEDAQKLSSILMRVKKEQKYTKTDIDDVSEEIPEAEEEVWTHKLNLSTLLKIGLSTNYLRGFALILAFFTTIYNESRTLLEEEELSSYLEQIRIPAGSVSFLLLLFILLLLMSVFITVTEVFFKYFGLKLQQTKSRLVLEMGLNTNTKVSLQPRRVQLIQIITNPVQKRFNLYEARIALASSQNELQKQKIKIPGLGKDTVQKVRIFLHGDERSRFTKSFRPHQLLLQRRLFIAFLPVPLSLLLLFWFEYTELWIWLIFAGLYTVVSGIFQLFYFRSLRLILTEDFLQKQKGVWSKTEAHFELYKMQAISINQPFWYRRRNLVNLVFHTAGGDVSFRAVSKAILPYINYILYKAETTQKNWM